jgi:predicted Ser/Thr protein kinase
MGRVWLARDEVLHRDVAIKEVALPHTLSDDEREELRLRTMREARAAARLSHPNVVRIYDVVRSEDQPWIVMEYIRARSLFQVVNTHGPLGEREVAAIGLAILSALVAAHRTGVLHRDVKPSDVLIADDGRVLLTDFGLATLDENEGAVTQTGLILGSPQYISPERAKNGISTAESDLWSLGATLYAAIEGRAPYSRRTAIATLVALATEKPDPMLRAGPLRPVIAGLLRRKPRSRMSAQEAQWRLHRIAAGEALGRYSRSAKGAQGSASLKEGIMPTLAALGRPVQPVSATAPVPESWAARAGAATGDVPAGAGAGPGGSGRWAWVAAGVAAAAILALGAVALRFDLVDRSSAVRQPVAGATGPATRAAQAPGAAAARPGPTAGEPDPKALPAGWNWYQHQSGFRVTVPVGWTIVQQSETTIAFCAPGGPPVVMVGEWNAPDPAPLTALQRAEQAANLPGYRRIRIDPVADQMAAEWEYTFSDPKMGALHGVDRGVVVNGRRYLIQWRTAASDWQRQLPSFGLITKSFQPPRRSPLAPL